MEETNKTNLSSETISSGKQANNRKLKRQFSVIEIDGARFSTENSWGLIRASNTQPALILRFESDSEKRLSELKSFVENLIVETQSTIL